MLATTIRNPLTGRMIKKDGRTFKKVNKLKHSILDFQAIVKQQLQKSNVHKKHIQTIILKNDVKELQRDVVKQKEKTKKKQKKAKNLMTKLNVNELIRLVKKQLQKSNETKKQRQTLTEKITELDPKILMIPLVNNVAFKRALETFIIKPLESNKFNFEKFIKDIYYKAFELLSKQLKTKRGMRVQFTLLADFYLSGDEEQKLSERTSTVVVCLW